MMMRLVMILCLLLAGVPSLAAQIEPVVTPLPAVAAGGTVLTIKNGTTKAALTLADLERLPLKQSTVKTAFGLEGTFQGVLLNDLLAAHGLANTAKITVIAGDGYVISFSHEEMAASPGMIATRLDGKPINDSARGPLLLIWPEQEQEVLAGRKDSMDWVWSIEEIRGKP
jgi:hypothetical protein